MEKEYKKPKQFYPRSEQVRYDKESKLWIPNRKRLFLYWFKYLQYAQRHPDYKVNWRKYRGWGSGNYILGVKFDDFWNDNWMELFGYPEGKEPKFTLSTTRPKVDSYRYALLIFENQHRGDNWELALWLEKKESKTRHSIGGILGEGVFWEKKLEGKKYSKNYRKEGARKRVFDEESRTNYKIISDDSIISHAEDNDLEVARTAKQEAMRKVAKYKRDGHKYLKNVCEGRFP